MGRHRIDEMARDDEGGWDGVVQYSEILEPQKFIRYLDRNGQHYEVVNA